MYKKRIKSTIAVLIILSLIVSSGLAENRSLTETDIINPLLSAVENDSVSLESYTLVTDDQRMQYDCISFTNSWPEFIMPDMEKCFQTAFPICGLYCLWRPAAGESLAYIFVACRSDDTLSLLGAQYRDGKWTSETIADTFFRPDELFAIAMHPGRNMDGDIAYYHPAVIYPGERFVFVPTTYNGFEFQYYERDLKESDEIFNELNESVHLMIEMNTTALSRQFVVSSVNNGIRSEIYRGNIAGEFDAEHISSLTFPTTLEEVMYLCEPNG